MQKKKIKHVKENITSKELQKYLRLPLKLNSYINNIIVIIMLLPLPLQQQKKIQKFISHTLITTHTHTHKKKTFWRTRIQHFNLTF